MRDAPTMPLALSGGFRPYGMNASPKGANCASTSVKNLSALLSRNQAPLNAVTDLIMGKCFGKRRRQGPASHGVHGKQDSYLKSPQKSKLHSHFGPLRSRLTVRGEYMQAAGIRQYVDEFTLECGHRSQALNQALRRSPCLAQHAMTRNCRGWRVDATGSLTYRDIASAIDIALQLRQKLHPVLKEHAHL